MTGAATPWRETGNTDYSSFAKAISRSVQPGSSPMATEAAAIYDALRPYGLTRLSAAMSWHERKNDSWGPSYGLDSTCRNPWAMRCNDDADACRNGWSVYSSYSRAAAAWARRLTSPYGPYQGTVTLGDLVSVYAPASDNNDEGKYVATISREIDALPLVGEAQMGNPFRMPVVHELYKDYARYGLTQAQAIKVGNHKFPNRSGKRPMAIVLHRQEGTTRGSLSWWASGNADASSTVMVNLDGSLLRCIPTADGPWTNGDANKPSAKGQSLIIKSGGGNLNLVTLSIEMEGYSGDRLSEEPLLTVCWQVTEWMTQFGLTIDDIYKHSDINSVTRSNCPGVYWEQVMERLRDQPEPAPAWPNKPAWMPDDLVLTLFPEAAPNGPRTNTWFRYCELSGRAPRRVAFHFKGTARELIEFSDGTLIDRAAKIVGRTAA